MLNSARSRSRYYEAVVLPLRDHIVQQTQLQYNAMQVPTFQLLEAKRDLVTLGAYTKGTDRELDEALRFMPRIEQFLRQDPKTQSSFETSVSALQRTMMG